MKPLGEVLNALEDRPFGRPWSEWPACSKCGQVETNLVNGLCWGCEHKSAALAEAEKRAKLFSDRAGTLHRMGVPEAYRRPFEDRVWPVDAMHKDRGTHDWRGEPWSVTLLGEIGAGKTYFAVELLWRTCGAEPTAEPWMVSRFVLASDVPALWFGATNDGEREALCTVRWLVIDDLGLGHQGGAWEALDDLFCRRYAAKLATIVTTRWTLKQLGEFAGSTADRLAEGILAVVSGRSLRAPERRRR